MVPPPAPAPIPAPSNGTAIPVPPPPPAPQPHVDGGARHGRYILLESGGVYDTLYDIVLPSRAQYVIQRGQLADRDIYLGTGSIRYNTVPLKDYVISTVV